jgi:hypothetical protein
MLLKAPTGCGSVSFGGQEYPVVEGLVEVPAEAAAVLLEPGWGFEAAAEIPPGPPLAKGGEEAAPSKTDNRKPKTGS